MPGRTAKPWLGELRDAPSRIATRGLGVRDLLLALGAIAAAVNEESPRTWLAACAAADAVDLIATVTAEDGQLPPRSKPGTTLAAGAFGITALSLSALSPER